MSSSFFILTADVKIVKYKLNYQLQIFDIRSIDYIKNKKSKEVSLRKFFNKCTLKKLYKQKLSINYNNKAYKFVISDNDSIRSKCMPTKSQSSLLLPIDKKYIPSMTKFPNSRIIIRTISDTSTSSDDSSHNSSSSSSSFDSNNNSSSSSSCHSQDNCNHWDKIHHQPHPCPGPYYCNPFSK